MSIIVDKNTKVVVQGITGDAGSFHARQMITHGHFRLNGHYATVPSMLMNKNDVVSFREQAKNHPEFGALVESNKTKSVPGWLNVDWDNKEINVLSFPNRDDITFDVEEHLVVESVTGTVAGEPAALDSNVLFGWRTLADERYYLDTGGLDNLELDSGSGAG